ncbi:MAG: NAD-dependent DNA ligase LigA [Bacteroidales bacterium]|nr:NAD-dependent DNA ligase LigA [Bacteroidales bacterium]
MDNKELDRIAELREQLHKHNYNYYVKNNPEISDYEFDALLKELQNLEAKHPEAYDPTSPTQRVGSDLSEGFTQEVHEYPMLSLANSYSMEDLREFDSRVRKAIGERDFCYTCELKYDGLSISLQYKDGKLTRALTRGNGIQGDNITNNAKTIGTIPLLLHGDYPKELEIRGEVVMPRAGFNALNEERIEQGEQPFANPRNAASGSLKLQNSREVARRPLQANMYYIPSDAPTDSHFENLSHARSWGFNVPDLSEKCKTIDDVYAFITKWDTKRKDLPFDTDGVVIKVDSVSLQQELGMTAKTPRWAIAFKFKAEQARTKLLSVDFQVGRQGTITPVANLEPVPLAGTVIRRASLYNADQMKVLGIRLNDYVYIEKGGEIIPKVVRVDEAARDADSQPLHFITHCPECGAELVRMEEEANYYCPNSKNCPPQIKGKIEHFVGRDAMNIALAGATIEQLYNVGLLRNASDFYSLTYQDVITLDRFAEKSSKNLIDSIQESKSIPFYKVLYAIGIRHIGKANAKVLAKKFKSIDAIQQATLEELRETEDVGEVIAVSIKQFFQDADNVAFIQKLRENGVQLEEKEKTEAQSNLLEGKTIVISGTFQQHSRDEMKDLIEANGGKNVSGVSKSTNYLLAGDGIGPSKLEKATTFGVQIITEDEFYAMIGLSDEVKDAPKQTNSGEQLSLF